MNTDNLVRIPIREFRKYLKEHLMSCIKESIVVTRNNDDFVIVEFIGDKEDFENDS